MKVGNGSVPLKSIVLQWKPEVEMRCQYSGGS